MNKARISMTLTSCCECPHSDTIEWKTTCLKEKKIVPLIRIVGGNGKIYYNNVVPDWCPYLMKQKKVYKQCSKCKKVKS